MTEAVLLLEIGGGIERIMKQKNISKYELSRKTNLTRSLIYRYINGSVYPSARNLTKILNALNTSLHEITRPAK